MRVKEAILVSYPDDFRQQEAKSLVESADYRIVKVFSQRYLNHSTYGIGPGKVQEIKEFLLQKTPDVVIVDEHITAKQMFNLEKITGLKVIDRERLILDIFYSRATTSEAKLQIQLAEVKYELPRVREGAKAALGSERPGKGGGGEYVVDIRFRDLKRRMGFISGKLSEARRKRELYQSQRARNDLSVIALLGYTSSGKTTLFNTLTNENKQTSANLFTTLSTTTRSFFIDNQKLLLTDTVGFISRLPTYMIEAFKSTLEESLTANIILLLIDASQRIEEIRIKYSSCLQILDELNVDREKLVVIFTKCDKSAPALSNEIVSDLAIPNPVFVSAKTGYGMRKLKRMVVQHGALTPLNSLVR
ncbi:MAG TPA: GTPase HflX [Nitrososphaeraceae archaeon]